ncbi:MAG: LytTR family DNA-binding domain-containing protein [Salinivirgaceae bacterium]|nr:LytTR family DNA-binding domain-containing protein [Salinivirgaceae bacterium]
MKRILMFLKEPFPPPSQSTKTLNISVIIGFSVFAILAMFQPFGLSQLQTPGKLFIIGGYGFVTAAIVIIFLQLLPVLFKRTFSEKNWVVWKHGTWLLTLVLTIGIGNLLYTSSIFEHSQLTVGNLVMFEIFTIMVGIFPVTGSILYSYIKHLKRNMALVRMLQTSKNERTNQPNDHENVISLTGSNKGESLTIVANDLLLIKSEGNYLNICYIKDNKPHWQLIRNTLKKTLLQTSESPNIIQCHRAYIVNTTHICQATGNAQGLKLTLNHIEETIPVSRNYVSIVKSAVQN